MIYPEHTFRELSQLDIDNLRAGRITRDTIHEAAKRVRKSIGRDLELGTGLFSTEDERMLADELNDMLRLAKELDEKP